MVSLLALSSCAEYQSQPITQDAIEQQLRLPSIEQLTVQAAAIKHPRLKPIQLNLEDGVSPSEAAILAVILNPDLRAIRDQQGIASAQLLQAGLLPDPQVSYSFTAPSGGTDLGMNNAFGIGLSWQVTSLLWQQNKIIAAEKDRQNINMQIAWQEWQFAQAAKLAAYQLFVYNGQKKLLAKMAQRLEDNRERLQQAAEEGLISELERVAAVSAKNQIDIRLFALEQLRQQQLQRLKRAMGVNSQENIELQQHIDLLGSLQAPKYDELILGMENRRLDIMAFKRGYESQDEQLHIAVMQQFPQISIGFDHARDNSNLYTVGFGISMSIPLFDRNRGQIAIDRATRQQMFDQYSARVFQARADIAEALVTITSINDQIQSVDQAIPELANLVRAYRTGMNSGQVDVLNYYTAWNNLTDKKIKLLTLKLQLMQAKIALEIASGHYSVETDNNGKTL